MFLWMLLCFVKRTTLNIINRLYSFDQIDQIADYLITKILKLEYQSEETLTSKETNLYNLQTSDLRPFVEKY